MPKNKKTIRTRAGKLNTGSRSIALKILLVLMILLTQAGLAWAQGASESTGSGAAPASGSTAGSTVGGGNTTDDAGTITPFDVQKYLTVKSGEASAGTTTGEQKQKYLQSSNPTAAFIVQAINLVTLTAAPMSFLAIVVAGFMMMTSAGNENQRSRGIEILTKAIIGLVITLSAYFIVAFVQNLLFETVPK